MPACHVDTIIAIARELGPQPRYVVARELTRRIDVTMKTALDYILSAVNEKHLEKIGMNVRVRN